ncbi:restriction endonuclease subunit S [Gelidibacter japonicus]|uniref:restriction endonuclease subunit S n=1 Tax=Gelidibacter japonicus TaxID=1962232 RepID=UPI003A9176CE
MSQVKDSVPEGWVETTLGNEAIINPRESIKKGEIKINVPMACIDSFTKKINVFEKKEFKGGTKFRNGDTLLARITPCLENGKTAFVDILDDNEVGFGSTEYIVIREKEYHTDKQFLYYLSISPNFREIAIKAMTGTSGRQRVQTDVLVNKILPFPPLPEQKAIANVLTAFDDKIENLRAQNDTLEQTAQTIFTEWFGKYQIGDLSADKAGELPEGWRVGKLGDEFNISIGRTPPRKETHWFSNIPIGKKWISIKDIGNCGVYIEKTSEYLTNEAIKKFNIPIIPENTTILSFKMTVGKLTITTEEMLSNEAIAHLKLKENTILTSEYIYLYLQNLDFNSLGSTSSIVTAINSTIIKDLDFIIPSIKVMEKLKPILNSIFSKIKNNTTEIKSLSQTRDTLLPKLMSGELRVKNVETLELAEK